MKIDDKERQSNGVVPLACTESKQKRGLFISVKRENYIVAWFDATVGKTQYPIPGKGKEIRFRIFPKTAT